MSDLENLGPFWTIDYSNAAHRVSSRFLCAWTKGVFPCPISARTPFRSGCSWFLRCGKDRRQFPKVLGGVGEQEFVGCAAWPAQSRPPEAKTAFEMREQHLDLLSQLHRDVVLLCLGDVAGDLAGVFMLFAGDGSKVHVGAALGF